MARFKFRVPIIGSMIVEIDADTEEEAFEELLDEMPEEDDFEIYEWDYNRADAERVGD